MDRSPPRMEIFQIHNVDAFSYSPTIYRDLHYITYGNDGTDNADPGCGQGEGPHGKVTDADRKKAGIPPQGEKEGTAG
jgi:hypothetical protein